MLVGSRKPHKQARSMIDYVSGCWAGPAQRSQRATDIKAFSNRDSIVIAVAFLKNIYISSSLSLSFSLSQANLIKTI